MLETASMEPVNGNRLVDENERRKGNGEGQCSQGGNRSGLKDGRQGRISVEAWEAGSIGRRDSHGNGYGRRKQGIFQSCAGGRLPHGECHSRGMDAELHGSRGPVRQCRRASQSHDCAHARQRVTETQNTETARPVKARRFSKWKETPSETDHKKGAQW